MVTSRKLNSIIQSLQSLSPIELAEVLQALPQLEISALKQLLAHLSPRRRVELMKQLIFATRPEYIEDLKYVITTEYQLRQSRGELMGEAAPLLSKTKLEMKRIPYQRKQVVKGYTYVYAMRRCDGVQRCLGRLLQTEDSHEYRYTLLENGGITFDSHTIFRLTSLQNPQEVMCIRLLKLGAPPLEYEFENVSPLELQVPLFYEVLHPQTYHPVSQEKVDFPACVNEGLFKKQLWQIEAIALPDLALEGDSAPLQSTIEALDIPEPQASQVIEALTYWQRLSQVAFGRSPWYLTTRAATYQLIHSDGQAILEFRLREGCLSSPQSPSQVAQYFQQLGLGLMQTPLSPPSMREEGARLSAQMQSFLLSQAGLNAKRQTKPMNILRVLLEI